MPSILIWYGAQNFYLELLDKLEKQICNTVGPSLAAFLEPLAHHQNVASLSLFYLHYFGRCSSELAQLVPLHFSCGRSTRQSDTLHDFSVTIRRCYKDVYVNSFFPWTAKLWDSLPIECFSLTYNLVAAISYQIFVFYQIIALQKLWKMFFISSKKLFSFSRYSHFCIFFPSFPHFPDSKGQMEVE